MAQFDFSHDYLVSVLDYSADTGAFVWRKSPSNAVSSGHRAGSLTVDGYVQIYVNGVPHKAHRLAWFYVTKSVPVLQVDHINGDRADNRWDNIREATNTQNQWNSKTPATNSSGYKGVYYRKDTGKWCARCVVDGVCHPLGSYPSPELAGEAYRNFTKVRHGKFYRQHKEV